MMESNEPGWADQADSILSQLLIFAAQLAELENDPQVDAKAISGACVRRLDELKQLIPRDPKDSPASKSQVLEKMRGLYTRTQVCLEILERKNSRIAAELQTLLKTRQAINAYSNLQKPK